MKILAIALSLMLGLSLLITINCRPTRCECISLKQAENIVLYKIVRADTMEWDTTKIRVYELPYQFKKGDTLSNMRIYRILERECWYFFIDDRPQPDWANCRPCRHILIYCDATYEVINDECGVPCWRYWDDMIELSW